MYIISTVEEAMTLVKKALDAFGLAGPGQRVLVGFSGGPDSVFLVHALGELGFSVELAHLNHCLRPEADEDEAFVRGFAAERGLGLVVKRVDVRALAESGGMGLEEAGRAARYDFFREIADQRGLDLIATGHTLSDWLESLLMNLFRGAGLRGLRALPPKQGRVIRPLILLEKEDILRFLHREGIPYREDATNRDARFTRNWVRHELLPLIKERFGAGAGALRRQMMALNEAWDYLRSEALGLAGRAARPSPPGERIFNRDTLLDYNNLLFKMILLETVPGITALHLAEASEVLAKGGEVHLPQGWRFQASFGDARLFRGGQARWDREVAVGGPGSYPVPEANLVLEVWREPRPEGPGCHGFPGGILPFVLRTRRPGDTWGKKPLKDKMIDLKIPRWRRGLIPVAARGHEVFWIPGFSALSLPGKKDIFLEIRRLSSGFWIYDT